MKFSRCSASLLAALPLGVIADSPFTDPVSTSRANLALKGASTCCEGLKVLLGNMVSQVGESAYTGSLNSYYSFLNTEITPTCIVTPTTKEQVALAVRLLNIGSKQGLSCCNFAIRSGGHTPWAGSNNIEDGVTIDLSKLNHISLSADKKTVEVGPGNRWVHVYSHLEPLGLTVVGGRVDSVGVGGLITGGGISYFSPRYGYAADSVESFEVVLASGDIVDANKRRNPDLWKALKGGSSNFGIVTSFRLRTYEQGTLWGGHVGLDLATIDQQCEIFEAVTGSSNYDPYASWIFSLWWAQSLDSWVVAHSTVYSKPEANPAVYRPLLALPQTFNTVGVKNLTTLTIDLGTQTPIGRRQDMSTLTFRNSAALMREIMAITNASVAAIAHIPNVAYAVSFQPVPVVLNSKAASTGGNSLGLDASDGPLVNFLLNMSWDDKADDAKVAAMVKATLAQITAKAKAMGKLHEYVYLNYATSWQDPISGYGADVKAALRAVSRRYDPSGLFQKNMPAGFKLS
ncbi:prosolanapyrone-II oxidase [Microdochium nivale]|nr:prosolanapyrone-II oxidase [Microdochium nivale]